MKTRKLVFIIFISIVFTCSCKKLNETVGGNLTTGQVANNSAAELLRGVYASLAPTFTSYLEIFALSDMTTDEAIIPTRGNNWDDNGMWRVLHQHKWDPGNTVIRDCFKSLAELFLPQQIYFNITLMLSKKPKQDFFGHGLCTGCWICLTRFHTGNRERMLFNQLRFVKE